MGRNAPLKQTLYEDRLTAATYADVVDEWYMESYTMVSKP